MANGFFWKLLTVGGGFLITDRLFKGGFSRISESTPQIIGTAEGSQSKSGKTTIYMQPTNLLDRKVTAAGTIPIADLSVGRVANVYQDRDTTADILAELNASNIIYKIENWKGKVFHGIPVFPGDVGIEVCDNEQSRGGRFHQPIRHALFSNWDRTNQLTITWAQVYDKRFTTFYDPVDKIKVAQFDGAGNYLPGQDKTFQRREGETQWKFGGKAQRQLYNRVWAYDFESVAPINRGSEQWTRPASIWDLISQLVGFHHRYIMAYTSYRSYQLQGFLRALMKRERGISPVDLIKDIFEAFAPIASSVGDVLGGSVENLNLSVGLDAIQTAITIGKKLRSDFSSVIEPIQTYTKQGIESLDNGIMKLRDSFGPVEWIPGATTFLDKMERRYDRTKFKSAEYIASARWNIDRTLEGFNGKLLSEDGPYTINKITVYRQKGT